MDDLTAVAAAFAALVAIGGALYYWFQWQPVHKPWCIILYHVSRDTNAGFDWPNPGSVSGVNALDEKLDQVVDVLDNLPCASVLAFVKTKLLGTSFAPQGVDWEDVHVVHRAVWNDAPFRPAGKRAQGRVVSWRPKAPSLPDDQILGSHTSGDRDGFLNWAYQNCPADHYALFYWGHSIGPGGLFELNGSVKFPPLPSAGGLAPASLIDVSTTLDILRNLRMHGGRLTVPLPTILPTPPGGPTPPPGGPSAPGATPASGKADVVLFQDCWMSTLETAFELQDLARYIVSSQSVVPIGYTYSGGTMTSVTGPVWPYDSMIAKMLANPANFIDDVADDLRTFYTAAAARAPFPVSVVSVLDLGLGGEIRSVVQPPITALVQALSMLSTGPTGPYAWAYRWAFLDGGGQAYTLDPMTGQLESGDWALRDVVRLCRYLSVKANHPTGVSTVVSDGVRAAAISALAAIVPAGGGSYSLVRNSFTLPASSAGMFEGVSLFWIPNRFAGIPPHDGYLAKQVDSAFYRTLRLVTETTPIGAATGDSWAKFAFEQL